MNGFSLMVCSLPIVLASSIAAGGVRNVGPGQPYATVQEAIDASTTGDLILVDPGTYPAFAISGKGVAVVAANGGFIVQTAPGVPAILVQNVLSGRTVSVLGAEIHYSESSVPAVRVLSNAGAVRFSRLVVSLDGDLGSAPVRAAVEVESTPTFWLAESSVWSDVPRSGSSTLPTGVNDGISAVELWNSDGVFQNVRLRGYDNPVARAGDGLRIRDRSWVWLRDEVFSAAGSQFMGGSGGTHGGHALHQINPTPQDGLITMCPMVGMVAGTGPTRAGGLYGINNNPGITVGPNWTTHRIPDGCTGQQGAENVLTGDTVSIGGTLDVRLWSVTTRNYATVLTGRTLYGRRLSGFYGHPLVDLTSRVSLVLSSGTLQGGIPTNLSIPVPAIPDLAGFQLSIQTAIGPTTGFNALSAPALAVIVP